MAIIYLRKRVSLQFELSSSKCSLLFCAVYKNISKYKIVQLVYHDKQLVL